MPNSIQNEQEKTVLLTKLEYCHVINNNTGEVRLLEGPIQYNLQSNESIYDVKRKKIILQEGQYMVIINPYNAEKNDVQHGDREVRKGPVMFSLRPSEVIDSSPDGEDHDYVRSEFDDDDGFHKYPDRWDGVRTAYVLKFGKALLIKAIKTFEETIDGKSIKRNAGDQWLITGPTVYIPHKYAIIKRKIKSLSIGSNEGIYIKNYTSGAIRLIRGPTNYILQPEEELWEKDLTASELQAIGWINNKGDCVINKVHAHPLWLLENEAMLIMDESKQRVEIGPKVVLLEPFERPYIMSISGKTPKVQNALKIWKIRLGPDFMTDQLDVRTKDNADLEVKLRYKWRFNLMKENAVKIFKIKDFIGFATETMAGIIRNVAAQYDFEVFHSKSAELIKEKIFGKENKPYGFELNGFEIFDIDIKKIAPKDANIAQKLANAITSNMEVYVDKIKQNANMEAEKEKIAGQKVVEESRKALITIQIANDQTLKTGMAKAEAEALIQKAKAEAEALTIKSNAETEATKKMMSTIIAELKNGGKDYIALKQVESLASVKKIIIPADSKFISPQNILDE